MISEHGSGSYRRARPARRALDLAFVLLLIAGGWLGATVFPHWLGPDRIAAQSPSGRLYVDYQVLFELSQHPTDLGRKSDDQLTVIFSNRSAEGAAPVPFFGEDILQEFSFSGFNLDKGQLRVSRRVRDKSFVDARYIRLINHGTDGWTGDRMSLTVDGEPVLRNVSISPRRGRTTGASTEMGLQKFNPRDWAVRSYWEAELQSYRSTIRR